MNKRKGISPLIASVLLIAFTMAIAGIMATWATTFSRQKLDVSAQDAECIGVLDVSDVQFLGTNLSIKIKNVGFLNLTGLRAFTEYTDKAKGATYTLSTYGIADPFPPGEMKWAVIDTADTAKPIKVTVVSQNCPKNEATLEIR